MTPSNLASFNVADFDKLVQRFYEGNNTERQAAQTLLTEFRKNADSWQVADQILEHSLSLQSKFIALGILQDFIKVKWNLLPMEQRLAMRNYIVNLIIELASNENTLRSTNAYINKLDEILVQILKKDWPKYWPTFIHEMVESSKTNPALCENNMKILQYLSEEVFDFSSDFMTVAKKRKLKNQMVIEFQPVFDLCKQLLHQNTTNSYLRTATLRTLSKFISWIPAEYVFNQELTNVLQQNFEAAKLPLQKNLCLQCFIELVSSEQIDIQQHSDFLLYIYSTVYNMLSTVFPADIDLNQLYLNLSHEEQRFFQLLAMFFAAFTPRYAALLEEKAGIQGALQLVLKLSRISEREIWKICLETWSALINNILETSRLESVYEVILQELCHVMIDNMVQPDDILMIENDEGEITREFVKQSDTTVLSKTTQQVFNQLARILPVYIQNTIHGRLKQLQFANTTWDQLFHLSWAIGFISGALSKQDEDSFLTIVLLQDISQLFQRDHDSKNHEWVVASCIFYIVEKYPRFLMEHSEFASVLFQKLFGYMQNDQSNVREMACDAFAKISNGCKQGLSQPLFNGQSVLEYTITNLNSLTAQLDSSQFLLFYEAVSTIIASMPEPQAQEQTLAMLMDPTNAMISSAIKNMDSLTDLKTIVSIIKVNIVTCETLGPVFQPQLQKILPILTQIYEMSSQRKYPKAPNMPFYQRICGSILELIETFVSSLDQLENQSFVFSLIQAIMMDYKNSKDPTLKECRVLRLILTSVEKCQKPVWPDLLKEIIDIEYIITLPLITSNFVDYPDFRLEFYRLLQALNKHCFAELYQPNLFQLNMDSIMWGTKHTIKDVSEIALQTCLYIIEYVSQMEDEDMSSQFFETYYVRILTDILEVLVDPDCRNGFNYQSQILARLLEMVQEGEIYTRLFNPEQVQNPLMSNVEYIQQYVLNLLCTAFPLLQKDQIEVLVKGMFEYSGELGKFQDDIRDFLIDIREVGDEAESQQRVEEELNAELDLLRNSS